METKPFLTVFYADDDMEDLDMFRDVAESIDPNLELFTHNSGINLLNALDNPPPTPHVLFLDINMPGYNGLDVLEKLRSSDQFATLPVVMFSTTNDADIIERSRKLGANFFVSKSGHFPTLKKSIEDTLKIDWSTFSPNAKNFVYAA